MAPGVELGLGRRRVRGGHRQQRVCGRFTALKAYGRSADRVVHAGLQQLCCDVLDEVLLERKVGIGWDGAVENDRAREPGDSPSKNCAQYVP
ncbi:MAG: hypothetical protein AAGA54_34730 [Myxococcota bacterium]